MHRSEDKTTETECESLLNTSKMSQGKPSASQMSSGDSWHTRGRKVQTRAVSAAEKIVKESKRKAAQEELEKVRLEQEDLQKVLHLKYLGIMQSGDGDPIVPVDHRMTISWTRFRDLKHDNLVDPF